MIGLRYAIETEMIQTVNLKPDDKEALTALSSSESGSRDRKLETQN